MLVNKTRATRIMVFLLITLMVVGCSSTTSLQRPGQDELLSHISPGNRITVYTKSGEKIRLKVKEVNQENVVGYGQSVAFKDIEKIDIKRADKKKNAVWVIALELVVVLASIGALKYLFF